MVKSKSNKSRLLKEFQELIVSEAVSHELHVFLVESLSDNHDLRKGFGLKPRDTSKIPPASISDPIYFEILKQRLRGKNKGQAIIGAGTALSKTDELEDIEKSIRKVKYFYNDKAGGQNKKNIEKTIKLFVVNKNYSENRKK